jgi:hypothetical protein
MADTLIEVLVCGKGREYTADELRALAKTAGSSTVKFSCVDLDEGGEDDEDSGGLGGGRPVGRLPGLLASRVIEDAFRREILEAPGPITFETRIHTRGEPALDVAGMIVAAEDTVRWLTESAAAPDHVVDVNFPEALPPA